MQKEADDFHKVHFDSIQALRGIAALFVVLEHIRFINRGAFGVDVFFCISGFMMMLSTHNHSRHFLAKRLIRILPLYYIMTIFTFVLLALFPEMFRQTKAEPVFLLKSLLFIPFDIGEGAIQPLMRVGWTVNCEIMFYLLFFAALKINHKYRGLICSIFLLLLMGTAQLLPQVSVPLSFYGNPVMAEFIFGIAVYYGARKIYELHQSFGLPRFTVCISLLCIAGCTCALLLLKPAINVLSFSRPLKWGLPAAVIVMAVFVLGLRARKIPTPLVTLGNASFSLYLMHYYPVMFLDRMLFDFSCLTPYSFLGMAAAIAVSAGLALISREFLEKRVSRLLTSIFRAAE